MRRAPTRCRVLPAAWRVLTVLALCGGGAWQLPARSAPVADARAVSASDAAAEERILALDAEHISAAQVRDVLSAAPAPRIISLQGSLSFVTMQPFAEFLIAMGFPDERLRNPADGSLTYSSYADSRKLAGTLAWYFEREGMMPMLIGHSQGGMLAIRVLYELAGSFHASIAVWNPRDDSDEGRNWITDPADGTRREVVGLQVPYAAALATGKLPRLLFGQWSMLGKLREIPDTVADFTGYTILWDPIAGTFPGSEPYRATGRAHVRNVELPAATSHIGLPNVRAFAHDAATRAWIERYSPGDADATLAAAGALATDNDATGSAGHIVVAADVWYSIKKHWCLEAQRVIRARRMLAARNPP